MRSENIKGFLWEATRGITQTQDSGKTGDSNKAGIPRGVHPDGTEMDDDGDNS